MNVTTRLKAISLATLVLSITSRCGLSFQNVLLHRRSLTVMHQSKDEMDIDTLKAELTTYLKIRDERIKEGEEKASKKGKVIGGTRGNVVLDWVSGSPNKPTVVEEESNPFDYEELIEYGYGYLATPIMNAGGRIEMYRLMGMPPPPTPERLKPKKVPKLVIDRTGETDEARYKGLKLGQVIDDDEMGRVLEEVNRKKKEGVEVRKKLMEEEYEQPFADKRNTAKFIPEVTPEMLDEEGRKRGRAQSWARKVEEGLLKKDPYEILAVEGGLRLHAVFSALLVSFAFGKATPDALDLVGFSSSTGLVEVVQLPALIVAVACVGSAVACGGFLAKEKRRSGFVWGVKGFFGGIVAVLQLKGLEPLETRGEAETSL